MFPRGAMLPGSFENTQIILPICVQGVGGNLPGSDTYRSLEFLCSELMDTALVFTLDGGRSLKAVIVCLGQTSLSRPLSDLLVYTWMPRGFFFVREV